MKAEENKKLIMKRIEKKTRQKIITNIVEGKITNPVLEKDEKNNIKIKIFY